MAFIHELHPRFRDLDALGHVNNAVMVTFLEQARFQWWRGYLAGRPFEGEGFLIARVEADYRLPILLEDLVRIEVRCVRIGNTSFDLAYRVARGADGALLAEGKTVQVMLDFKTNRPAPLTAEAKAWLETQA
ncbi:MAG TPA: thioesterase family protein [Holophagaceae bacterium]|nr:thioesterase family protein [Holophagaceae bacterium]